MQAAAPAPAGAIAALSRPAPAKGTGRTPGNDLSRCQALVIDGNPASRTALAMMLRDFGVGDVQQATRALDARRMLEFKRFDFVVCEYHFTDQAMTGQDMVDDLRLAQLLPMSTVVVMVSSEAAYARVAEAAEAALDAYLIKPHTQQALCERLRQALARKEALKEIIGHVEQGEFEAAAELCQVRSDTRGPYWLNASRIGAELCLRLGRPQAAQKLFERILEMQALPWARLGFARTEYQAGGVKQARRTLESLLNDRPGYADAYDVMGRVLLDQGDPEQALNALRRACSLTPGSVARLQKFGLLSFYHGDQAEALDALKRATAMGINSKTFDLQGMVLLGTLHFDRGDTRGLGHALRSVASVRSTQPNSARLRRFETILAIFTALHERRVGDAVAAAREALAEISAPDFEFEAACNLLSMLARLSSREVKLEEELDRLKVLADRFAVSRTTTELLCRAALGLPEFEPIIRARYAAICEHAEEAVSHTVAGKPGRAVASLLDHAERSLNAKLIDLATHTLEQHGPQIAERATLAARAQALNERTRSYGTQVQLGGGPK